MIDLEYTNVFDRNMAALRSGKYRYIINEGGSRSSKSTSITQLYLYLASHGNLRLTAWRSKRTWIKPTMYADMIKYLKVNGLYVENDENKSELIYHFRGSTIECNGLDDYQKLHGMEQDYAWLNEGIECSKQDFEQIDMRTKQIIFIDYNPTEEEHWIFDLEKLDNAIFIKSTQLDNDFLGEGQRRKILSYEPTPENTARGTADEYSWQVYGLGNRMKREGVIFTFEIIKEWPQECEYLGNGLDFGFSPDPSASAKVGRLDGRLVIDELFHEHELLIVSTPKNTDSIEQRLLEGGIRKGRDKIIADRAAKSSIKQLEAAGFFIEGCKKYPGSVLDGVNIMRECMPFLITERSLNLKKELENYVWMKDKKTGKTTNTPIDAWNHIIDGVRYVAQDKLSTKKASVKSRML